MVGSAICPAVGQSNRLAVTVVDSSGVPMPDLKADNFTVTDRSSHTVSAAVYKQSPVDVVLLIESSAFTNSQKSDIERIAILLVDQLGPKDHMAIFGYSDAPEVMQEFTSNKQDLVRSVPGLRFGSNVSMFDSAYQVLDTAFRESIGRKVLLIISSGSDGVNRTVKQELVEVAEKRQVSIFAISLSGRGSFLDELTKETAGALLSGREIRQAAKNLFTAFRGQYELTVEGAELQAPIRVEVKGVKEKTQVSHRKE
jgi:VWFA-related protein